jgi:hypothetical protein
MRGAGGGRPRKPEGTARHRNKPTRTTIIVRPDARVEQIPEPALPMTGIRRQIWDEMWSNPIATLWDLIDVVPLTRLVFLQTSADALLDKGLLAEMRQLEDRFLLNPYARAQQRVQIEGEPRETPAESRAAAREQAATVARLEDRRRRLGA